MEGHSASTTAAAPAFRSAPSPPERPMMMIDLLRHTSGLTYSFQHRTNVDAAYRDTGIERWHGEHDLDSFVAALAQSSARILARNRLELFGVDRRARPRRPARLGPGRSSTSSTERIFAPLGMVDTAFHLPAGPGPPARRRLGAGSEAGAGAQRCGRGQRLVEAAEARRRRRRPGLDHAPIITVSARCF